MVVVGKVCTEVVGVILSIKGDGVFDLIVDEEVVGEDGIGES